MGLVASYPLLSQAPTHVEVELGCDKSTGEHINLLEANEETHYALGITRISGLYAPKIIIVVHMQELVSLASHLMHMDKQLE